jgi:lipid-A-disaccharide synthase
VSYVGHPLADMLPLEDGRDGARTLLGLSPQEPVFALLPGSRQGPNCSTWRSPSSRPPAGYTTRSRTAVFLAPLATRETRAACSKARCIGARRLQLPIRLLFGHAHQAMMAADVVLLASGTATLEAALLKRPMVIVYKMAPLSYRLMRASGLPALLGLPNVLAGSSWCRSSSRTTRRPRTSRRHCSISTPTKPVCERLKGVFREMHLQLRQNAAEKAAAAAVSACLPAALRDHAGPAAA